MALSYPWRGALPYLLMLWMSQILGVISSGKIVPPIQAVCALLGRILGGVFQYNRTLLA